MSVDASTTVFAPGARPRFHGAAGAMFPVVLKGLLLTIVTLGIYRFWYMTNVRRFLWNNSEIDGDFVEYTGRGVELFIGFLIALAVLIPFYGVIFLVGFATGPIGAAIVQFAASFGVIVLAQYALYRARRYRLTRTVWRGIRLQQTGSGWSYAWRSLGWALLVIITLGLAYPWMRASLERYKMRHTYYGDQLGGFVGTGGQLFKRGVLFWLLGLALVAIPVGVIAAAAATNPQDPGAAMSPMHSLITLAIPIVFLLIPLYLAVEFRWWAQGCSVGPATVRCDLGLFAFLKVYLGYVGVVVLFAIVVAAIGGAIGGALYAGGVFETKEPGPAQIAVMVGAALFYVVVALVFAALWQVFGIRPMWRKSLESVEIVGLGALMAAQSTLPEANAFGEGVADAIDFGGF